MITFMKKTGLLIVAALIIMTATSQALTYLPHSSYYAGGINSFYSSSAGVMGRVEFAVYDTVTNPDEFVGADGYADQLSNWSSSADGQYIYAYQVFVEDSISALEYFSIMGIGEGALTQSGQGSTDDLVGGGIGPDYQAMEDNNSEAVWNFSQELLVAGERSYVLYLISDHAMTTGTFTVERPDGEAPVPNPEPCTLALLGAGGFYAFRRRKAADK